MQMNKPFRTWKQLRDNFGVKSYVDAFLGSLMYTLFVIIPVILIYIQVMSMYYHRLYVIAFLMTITCSGIAVFQLWLWKKAFMLKRPELTAKDFPVIDKQMIINAIIVFLIGVIIILLVVPILQV